LGPEKEKEIVGAFWAGGGASKRLDQLPNVYLIDVFDRACLGAGS